MVPFHEVLERVFQAEWEAFNKSKHKVLDRLYTLPDLNMKKLKVPTVDTPIVAVSLATVLPSEEESGPKDVCNKRIEISLKRCFEAPSQTFRTFVASSIFSRATYASAEELASSDISLSCRAKCTLKRMAQSYDCAYDSIQLATCSMATNVTARSHLWLRQWQGN